MGNGMSHGIIDELLNNRIVYPAEADIVNIKPRSIACWPSHGEGYVIDALNGGDFLLERKLFELVVDNWFEVEDEPIVEVDEKSLFICVVDWVVIG